MDLTDKLTEYKKVCNEIKQLTLRKKKLEKEIKCEEQDLDCTIHLNQYNGRYSVYAYSYDKKKQVYITSSVYQDYVKKVYRECLNKCFEDVLLVKDKYRKNVCFNKGF